MEPAYNPRPLSSAGEPIAKCKDVKHVKIMSIKDLYFYA
jgi:hypothetical protein